MTVSNIILSKNIGTHIFSIKLKKSSEYMYAKNTYTNTFLKEIVY